MNNTLVNNARDLYQESLQRYNYNTGHIWDSKSPNILFLKSIIDSDLSAKEQLERVLNTDLYGIVSNDYKINELMYLWLYDLAFSPYLQSNQNIFNTANLVKMFLYCRDMKSSCIIPNNLVELGGGCGQFCYIANYYFGSKCVDIDIPESLYFTYLYLSEKCPNKKILWVKESKNYSLDDYDFILCPIHLTNSILDNKFDVFVNTCSMGEFSNDNILYWIDLIENKFNIKYFYGVNRFLNTVLNNEFKKLRINENLASVSFNNKWRVLDWELEPEFTRCPYEDTRCARYLRIILKKEFEINKIDNINDVFNEDWYRFGDSKGEGNRLSNQLYHDLTINGTLFKLWNKIRVSPTKKDIVAMLKYLNFIKRSDVEFEEEYFYRELLSKIQEG